MQQMSDVAAPCGTVHGAVVGGVHVFRGIPYALPPVGELRFAPPRPAPRVDDIDATRFGAISLQDIDPLPEALPGTENNFYAPGAVTSEDCLNLNVWTADPSGSAPVYVYIHGGAFVYGSGTGPWIDGARLAREHGIVVVTVNYRLGLLGGLYLGDTDPQRANFAIRDQIAALRWVRENIAAFGGDPDAVTIGGESAGAMSVLALLVAPDARGLFHRAVVESGHADAFVSLDTARASTATVLARLHLDPDADDLLARLREVSTLRLLAAQREFGIRVRTFPLVTDDVLIVADPLASLREGIAADIDLVIGSTRDEDNLFSVTGWAPPTRPLDRVLGDLLPAGPARDHARELYGAVVAEQGLDAAQAGHLVVTDHGGGEPVRTVVRAHAGSGGRTYHYEFAWASSVPLVGAAHLVDLPFFMGTLDAPGIPALLGDETRTDPATVDLGQRVSATLAQFVATGDLAASALGPWPAYETETPRTMIIDRESRVVRDHLADRLDFWQSQRGVSVTPLSTMASAE